MNGSEARQRGETGVVTLKAAKGRSGAAMCTAALIAACAGPAAAQTALDQTARDQTAAGATPVVQARTVPELKASNGAVVPVPKISGLDCPEMAAELHRIDESGYRGPVIVPPKSPDRPIFDYEDKLSRVYYTDCLSRGFVLRDPAPVFRQGFKVK